MVFSGFSIWNLVFGELVDLAISALTLPRSNAGIERIFSVMNIVKNKLRNRMEIIITELGIAGADILKDPGTKPIDIDLSDEIAGFLMTVFTCLRKEENDKLGIISTWAMK